jgi:hypothetical protein
VLKKGERINSLLYNLKFLSYTPLYTENNNQNTNLCLSTSSLLEYSFWAVGIIQYKSIFSIQYYMSQKEKKAEHLHLERILTLITSFSLFLSSQKWVVRNIVSHPSTARSKLFGSSKSAVTMMAPVRRKRIYSSGIKNNK